MSTLTFEMPTVQADALSREAERRGVRVEDLLRELVTEYLTQTEAFRFAMNATLQENAELYRRLAK